MFARFAERDMTLVLVTHDPPGGALRPGDPAALRAHSEEQAVTV
jgi:predicted ABC-type transport system involved in lysophospholipase L1 biosynthesis ATPase subunit